MNVGTPQKKDDPTATWKNPDGAVKTTLKKLRRKAPRLKDPEKDFAVRISLKNNHLYERRVALGLTQEQLCRAAKLKISTISYGQLEGMRMNPTHASKLCRVPTCTNKSKRRFSFVCASCLETHGHDPEGWPIDQWPLKRTWSKAALRLARFYNCPPEELFPATVQHVKKTTAYFKTDGADLQKVIETISMGSLTAESFAELPAVPTPEKEFEKAERSLQVRTVLATLTPIEEEVLRKRFGFFDDREQTFTEIADARNLSRERIRQIETTALRKLRHPSRSKRFGIHAWCNSCSVENCKLVGGYRCPSGAPYCFKHVKTVESCDCHECRAKTNRIPPEPPRHFGVTAQRPQMTMGTPLIQFLAASKIWLSLMPYLVGGFGSVITVPPEIQKRMDPAIDTYIDGFQERLHVLGLRMDEVVPVALDHSSYPRLVEAAQQLLEAQGRTFKVEDPKTWYGTITTTEGGSGSGFFRMFVILPIEKAANEGLIQ